MPTRTTIVHGHPTFEYRYKYEGSNAKRLIQFTFIDGIVFQVQG